MREPTVEVIFLNDIVGGGGGVYLGPLGTTATNKPIVPAPGDYDDEEIGGMMIGRRNRSTRRKLDPCAALPTTNSTCCPDSKPGRATVEVILGLIFLSL
jgi:hypothetical protein